jgi:hypothetical protein
MEDLFLSTLAAMFFGLVGFVVVWLLGQLVGYLWLWLDDRLNDKTINPVEVIIMHLCQYRLETEYNSYKGNNVWGNDGAYVCKLEKRHRVSSPGDYIFGAGIVSFLGAGVGNISYHYPLFGIGVGVLILLAFLTRMLLRLSKRLNAHLKDKEAHK